MGCRERSARREVRTFMSEKKSSGQGNKAWVPYHLKGVQQKHPCKPAVPLGPAKNTSKRGEWWGKKIDRAQLLPDTDGVGVNWGCVRKRVDEEEREWGGGRRVLQLDARLQLFPVIRISDRAATLRGKKSRVE